MKKINILFFALLIVLASKAQQPQWIVYDTSNSSLPGNDVYCLSIDNQGNKWIGTDNGLAKFNGNTWTTYDTSNSNIPHNNISALAIDKEGNKWIGTYQKHGYPEYYLEVALARFDGSNWTIYDTSNSKIQSQIKEIAIDSNGHKWFGSIDGIVKLEDSSWSVYNTSNTPLPSNGVLEIAIDKYGKKWISVGSYGWFTFRKGGLLTFDDTTWTVVYDYNNSGIGADFFNAIAFDDAGNKWMAGWGVAKYDDKDWTIYDKIGADVTTLAIDNINNIWIGFSDFFPTDDAIAKFNGVKWSFFNKSNSGLPSNRIYQITADDYGNKWIGTGGGVAVFNETGVSVEENRLTPQNITIFPNPTQGKVKLSMEAEMTHIEIFDLTGKEIMQIDDIQSNEKSIDLSDIRPGVYLLNIHTSDHVITRKIIKQ